MKQPEGRKGSVIRPPEWLFIDTSAFIALHDEDDAFHAAAVSFLTPETINRLHARLVTTNFVFAEVYAYFCRNHADAVAVGTYIRDSKILRYIRPDAADEEAAWEIARRYADKDFSFVDCLSFAVMRKLGCNRAFAFDSHFEQAGFALVPGRVNV